MRRDRWDRRARVAMRGRRRGVKAGMAGRGGTRAASFMMQTSFLTAASSWLTTPPTLGDVEQGQTGELSPWTGCYCRRRLASSAALTTAAPSKTTTPQTKDRNINDSDFKFSRGACPRG